MARVHRYVTEGYEVIRFCNPQPTLSLGDPSVAWLTG